MGFVVMTSASFYALPTEPPNGWPENLVWPAGKTIDGQVQFTIADSDMHDIMSWIATTYNAQLAGTTPPPVPIPAGFNIIAQWFVGFMKATQDSTQRHHTVPAMVPPPIEITGQATAA